MGSATVVVMSEDPGAMHLQGGVSAEGNGLTGVFLEPVTQQQIDVVDGEQGVGQGARGGGAGAKMQQPPGAVQVGCDGV